MESIYEKYKDQGFVILGFPANNFGAQEPGTNEEIKTFCTRKYSVTFPMYSKISVKGADQAPLYAYLTKETWDKHCGRNQVELHQFLVDRDGKVAALRTRSDAGFEGSDGGDREAIKARGTA